MNNKDYILQSKVTDHDELGYKLVSDRCANIPEILHYVLGVGSEAGELQDAIKKYIAYGRDIDKVNIKEEIGDLFWYIAGLCRVFDLSIEDIMQTNINKLKVRYGEKFSEAAALNRDLKKEREILED
jgi:NTP pyrophosphatase (non-canonical NTP hydrolase)